MIKGITLTITANNRTVDFAPILSTYSVEHEFEYSRIIVTLDGTEHFGTAKTRDIINFSLFPISIDNTQYYDVLENGKVTVRYTNLSNNSTQTKDFRVTTNLSSVFALKSINGKTYFKGGAIQLRAISLN